MKNATKESAEIMSLNRRQFLALTSLSALAVAFRPLPPDDQPPPEVGLGRVIAPRVTIRKEPNPEAERVTYRYADRILNIRTTLISDAPPEHNRLWYEVSGGYVHSSYIQPVRSDPQSPLVEFPGENLLVEVTVPFTDSRVAPNRYSTRSYRLYYGTTHWVSAIRADAEGIVWYRLRDDKWGTARYVRGHHLRRITADELAPLSPDVVDKRLEVDTEKQWVTAYEDGVEVFSTRAATGGWYLANDVWKDYTTPLGGHTIDRKMPSRHMAAGDLASGEGYDLPGVPWVSYFTSSGVAFHGTYWHNDFGRPRSHGCVNVTTEAAKWIYRWSLPVAPVNELHVSESGTRVIVY
jgi:hypothetical protein